METLKYLGERVLVLVDPAQNNGGRVAPAQITRVNEDETVNVSITLDVAGATGYAAHIPIVANLTEALATQEDSPVLNIAFWPADDDTPDAVADRAPADDQQRA